jgi:hypothetical protein
MTSGEIQEGKVFDKVSFDLRFDFLFARSCMCFCTRARGDVEILLRCVRSVKGLTISVDVERASVDGWNLNWIVSSAV